MGAQIGQSISKSAKVATMLISRRLCRLPVLAAAFIAGSPTLSLPSSSSGCARRPFVSLHSSRCSALPRPRLRPHSPPALPLFSISLLISGLRMSKVDALGSSSFSSSKASSAVGTTPEDVLQFWYKGVDPESGVYERKEWFAGGPEFDAQLEEKFADTLKLFSTGALDEWMKTVRGRLALVILLDQISRNVYRGSASSFSQDAAAREIALDTIEKGWDKELNPSELWFLYMPLMHSETLRDHEIVDRLYEDLANKNSDNEKVHKLLIRTLEFERKHSAVLKKFGRYPSRNAVLGRQNTKEEEEFLASGSGW
ncbi:unnamed protein product [Calypogeia fissa]